jgi:hypothetical protein
VVCFVFHFIENNHIQAKTSCIGPNLPLLVSVVSSNLSAMPWPDYKTVAEQICMLRAIQLAVKAYRHAVCSEIETLMMLGDKKQRTYTFNRCFEGKY